MTTQQKNAPLAALIEGMADMLAALDTDYRFIAFSRSYRNEFETIFGRRIEIGTNLIEALAHLPEEQARALDIWGRALGGEAFTVEQEFGDPRRGRYFYRITFSSIRDEQGNLIGATHIVRDITDLRHSEEALRASEERYRTLFEKMSEGFAFGEPVLSEDGTPVDFRFLEINPAFERQTGLTRETLNRPLSEVLPYLEQSWIDIYGGVAMSGRETRFENYNRDTGRHYDVFCFSPEPGKFAILFRDITERKEKEDRLRRNSETFHNLIRHNPFGVYIVDADFRMRLVSAGAQKVFSNIHPIIGRDFGEVMRFLWPEEFATQAVSIFRHTLETGEPYAQRSMVEQRMDVEEVEAYDWRIERIILPDGGFGVVCYFYDLSERQQWEATLRQSQERFRDIADNMAQLAWMADAKGWIFWYNKRWFDFTGTTLQDMEGWGWRKVHHPDHVERVVEKISRCFKTGEFWEDTFPLRGKDGSYRWFLSRAIPIRGDDGNVVRWFGTNTDITEQMKAEEALRKSEARWNAAIENLAQGAIIATEDEQVIYWNPAAREMHGFSRPDEFLEPLERTPITFQLWTTDDSRLLDLDEWPMRRIKRGESVRDLELRIRRPDQGWERVFSYSGTMIETAGGERLIFLTCHDLTDLRRAEQALRQLTEELERRVEQRTAELTAANREMEAFTYSVSHDLRAPLRHIASFVELLDASAGEALGEKQRRYIRVISSSAKRLGALIDDLLAFSRIGRAALRIVPVRFSRIVEESRRELAPEVEGRQIEWRIGDLPPVEGDPTLLRTVMTNLLANALKYTRHRDRAVIEISCDRGEGEAVFAVRDNGAGFDMRYADKLFGVFQRLHRAEEFEGTGVGLASVRRIVERHGGRVWAEGEVDRGATFYFALPTGARRPPQGE